MIKRELTIRDYLAIRGWIPTKPDNGGIYTRSYTIVLSAEREHLVRISVACKSAIEFVFGAVVGYNDEMETYPCELIVKGTPRASLAEYLQILASKTKIKEAKPILAKAWEDAKQLELFKR